MIFKCFRLSPMIAVRYFLCNFLDTKTSLAERFYNLCSKLHVTVSQMRATLFWVFFIKQFGPEGSLDVQVQLPSGSKQLVYQNLTVLLVFPMRIENANRSKNVHLSPSLPIHDRISFQASKVSSHVQMLAC